jgi:hypothetical protein
MKSVSLGRRSGAAVAVLAFALALVPAAFARDEPAIRVLSNRADLISGGDALVQIAPAGARVKLNGVDVSSAFAVRADGTYAGLVTGLGLGRNRLAVTSAGGDSAQLTITNHPIGGPVFAGPQVQPWICKNTANGLAAPTDAQCDATTVYSFRYMDAVSHTFNAYDPASPPPAAQIATTTTDQGVTVPYIVRLERGVMDRGIYDVAVLFDPARSWAPWASQAGWNHKLLYQFGGGTAPHHSNGTPIPNLVDMALSRGFMVANNSLNTRGQNSNDVVSAEALMMLKEHIAETYGSIRYTIGQGCSGGSIQQHVIANDYPGLLDGIQPNCSYQDSWTTGTEVGDCHLLVHYFAANPGAGFTPAQQTAVMGEQPTAPAATVCQWWENTFASVSTPFLASNCDMTVEPYLSQVYNPVTNPTGVRCTVQDYEWWVWGLRPDGFAKRPFDNVGVQYGLGALESGAITPEQFVDLNARIGGVDIDNQFQAARTVADPGSPATAYRTGKVTDGVQLANVPIVDLRGSHNVLDIHSDYHSYVMRARLDAANGNHDNQIIWTWQGGPGLFQAIAPDPTIALKSFTLVDRWLTAIESDSRHVPLSKKVVDDKPSDAIDSCFAGPTDTQITDAATCASLYPHYADPRIVAGSPLTDDVLQCRTHKLRPRDYPVVFSADQWARLQAAFPDGVCNYDRQGVGKRPAIPWLDYSTKVGGKPLGDEPESDD